MKYKIKLYLLFIGMAFGSAFLAIAVFYGETRRILLGELQSKVMTVASTAARGLDGDLIEQIQTPEDASTPAFQTVVREFLAIRDANRRKDIYVQYVYTIRPNPQDSSQLQVGIEASDEANPDRYAFTGAPYSEGIKYGYMENLQRDWASPELIGGRWGRFLTGLSPIYNSQGKYVATLGIDLSSESIVHDLRRLQFFAATTLAISLTAAILAATFVTRSMTRSFDQITEGVHLIEQGDFKARIILPTHDEFGNLADAINRMAKGLEEHERVKLNFVRYVSKHVLEKILASEMPALKGERRKITVLFSDIRDFTQLAEKLPPEEVVSLLNEYLEEMLKVIFEHNGTLDKFLGDGMMVEFGAPLADPHQEKHALETAIGMQNALKKLNEKWARQGRPPLKMGIGIHTGYAIVGNIGSEKRMEYTAIGDAVNVASRLEKATKDFKTSILFSESTKQGATGFQVTPLGPISLPGRTQPIVGYTLEI